MAITTISSGTQLAVISTEHTLATQTDPLTYVFVLDLVNLAASDELTIRLKSKVLVGGVTQTTYTAHYGPTVPTNLTVVSVPLPSAHEFVVTLEQTAGTGRNFPWEVRSLE